MTCADELERYNVEGELYKGVTSTGTHNNAKARSKTQMHRPTGEQDIRDRQNSGDCDGQLEVEWRIREDQSNADSMPRPPIHAQVTPG